MVFKLGCGSAGGRTKRLEGTANIYTQIAQLAELRTVNPLVVGSIPTLGAMTYNEWYIKNITPKEFEKINKSREQWIKNTASYSKKAAYSELENERLNRLLDDMAYVLDLLVDGPSDNRVWFKVKEVLDKYEKYKREQGNSPVVDLPNE